MAITSRIPRTIDLFDSYISTTSAYLLAGTPTNNGTRLGFSESEISGWNDINEKWTPVYNKYKDKKTGRTTAVKDQLLIFIDEAIEYDRTYNLLDRIAVSLNVTVNDLETFNIKKGLLEKTTRTIPTTAIKESVQPILIPFGGGTVTVKCYSSTSPRASIFGDADSVQYLYSVDTPVPESANTPGLIQGLSTRATFDLHLGTQNGGKRVYIFLRWYNTKHPELAGPWSDMQSTFLL
ncbi:MAG: hypothetical protein PHV20_10765 [Bacteroidales bacterium]|nr:hypothetical protein [Bacteroidales bacterium]